MHDIISFLKGAVMRGDAQKSTMSCYHFGHELVTARNESLQAGIYMESPISFVAPAAELEAVLARMKEITAVNLDNDVLTLKAGRLKASISCIADAPVTLQQVDSPWQPAPTGLTAALKLTLPFINDTGWNAGVRLMGNRLSAIKNTSGIDITLPGLECETNITIPTKAAEFLVAQGDPSQYTVDKGALVAQWEDGRWLRAQLLASAFPDHIDIIFDKATDKEALVEISAEWREAWADAAALAESSVEVTPHCLRSGNGLSQAEVEIETPVPEGHRSRWSVKVFETVLASATHWAPTMFPNPIMFAGPNLRGVVIGMAPQ